MLPGEFVLRHLQVRVHEGRLLHQLHQRRQGLLCDDPEVLRMPTGMLRQRLLLLRVLQRHARLLRYLRVIAANLRQQLEVFKRALS